MVDEILRLAWQADRDGRSGRCETLLTLAAAECAAADAGLAERCRRWLIARRPGHVFGQFRDVAQAIEHRRVAQAIEEIRTVYPPGRVRSLLLRAEAGRGPYRAPRPINIVCDELLGSRGPAVPAEPLRAARTSPPPQPATTAPPTSTDSLVGLYVVLLSAVTSLLRPAAQAGPRDSRAA